MTKSHLHFSLVTARSGTPAQSLLLAHGILGSGANLRGLAQQLVERDPSWSAVLIDLRGHGRSPGLSAPHDLDACAEDLCRLEAALPHPVAGIVGHSFGGKVALAYHARRPALARVALLDSAPFARPDRAGSEDTMRVIEMLEGAPPSFDSRAQFVEYVHARGHSRAIADWLAMNLERADAGFRLRTDLKLIRALLDDYFRRDLWDVLERSRARVTLVIGGRSRVWGSAELARAEELAARRPEVRVQVLPEAGHWVHVDDPEGVVQALTA